MQLSATSGVIRLLLGNPVVFLQINCGCVGLPDCGSTYTSEHFVVALHQTLLTHTSSELGISESLHFKLLLPDDGEANLHTYAKDEKYQAGPPFLGLPNPPYYRELAQRIHAISESRSSKKSLLIQEKLSILVAAESLGFEESLSPAIDLLPDSTNMKPRSSTMRDWLQQAGDFWVLRMIGIVKQQEPIPEAYSLHQNRICLHLRQQLSTRGRTQNLASQQKRGQNMLIGGKNSSLAS